MEYHIHLDEGVIEVDGESVETSIRGFFDSDDYHELNESKLEKLEVGEEGGYFNYKYSIDGVEQETIQTDNKFKQW